MSENYEDRLGYWDEEDEERAKNELSQTVAIQQEAQATWKAEEAAEQQQEAQTTEATPEATPQQTTEQPKQETPQQSGEQKQVPGWGADPKPEDRWNIRDRAPARSELEGVTDPLTIAEAASAPIVGTVDGMTRIYNTFTPGPDIPKLPQFQDKNLSVIRDVSEFVGPNFLGIGLVSKAAKGLQGVSAIPAAVHRLGANPIFKLFATTGLEMGIGGVVDSSLHKEGDHNFQGQLREILQTPEGENLFGIFPSSWATDYSKTGNIGPDQNRARVRNEGMGLGLFMGIGEGLVKIARAVSSTSDATRYVAKDDLAKQYFEKIKTDEFAQTKYSEDPIQDAVLRSDARSNASLDELGEFYVARANRKNIEEGLPFQTADELEFEGPVKGIHDSFDPLEQGVITPSPGGVQEVMVDAARIRNNIGTSNGILGSITTEGAMKYGLEADSLEKEVLVHMTKKSIKESGKFDYYLDGKVISDKQIDEGGTWLAEQMLDMKPGEMNELLDPFRRLDNNLNVRVVNDIAYDGVMKALKGYMDMFLDLDAIKARALLTTSYAGQASVLAGEWAKVSDTAATESARNMIMDRMEFLMVHKALASYDASRALSGKNVWARWDRLTGKEAKDYTLKEVSDREQFLGTLVPNVKGFSQTLLQIMEEKPNFLKPLFEAYHLTGGKVSSMYDLNRYVWENLGEVTQAVARGEDTMPNLIVSGMYSNYYNSILSSTATPVRAFVGNLGGIIVRPVTTLAGALMERDLETISRAAYQYAGVKDAFTNAYSHMSHFWKKTMENPMSTMEYGRSDLAVARNEKNIETLRLTADAMADDGFFGPQYLLNTYEDMHSIATNPWFRYSANMMGAADAFTRAFIATAEARGRAYDKLLVPGKKIKPSDFKKVADETYKSLHNAKGWISDEATEYYSKEIALNLDSKLAQDVSTLIQNNPWLKPIMLFPRTSVNILGMFQKYSPLAVISHDFWDLVKYGDNPPLKHVEEFLTKKGISLDANSMNTFNQMRREAKGRIAVGTAMVAGVSMMFSEDRVRGTGHWDQERQRVRTDNDWAPKTVLIGGKWVSYEFLGPIGDWVSLMADIRDNFDLISDASSEKLTDKMRYILAAAITDRSLMAQVEPLTAMMSGNGSDFQRFVANAANGAVPFAGARNSFSRLMTDGMKEVDNKLTELLRNKNNYLDGINPDGALGAKYSWVDKEPIGHVETWAQRAANAFLGFRVADKVSENREFLMQIEYDSRPAMTKSKEGVPYSSEIRSAIYEQMAEDGHFRDALTRIRNQKGAAYLTKIRDLRRKGYRSTDVDSNDLNNLHSEIDSALRRAQTIAVAKLDEKHKRAINALETGARLKESAAKRGTITPEMIDQINDQVRYK